MAVAVDASSPARATVANTANASLVSTAPFTPPSGSFIVVAVTNDTTTGETGQAYTLVASGITFTALVERLGTESVAGGYAGLWKGTGASGSSIQITMTRTAGTASSGRMSMKAYVLTGVDTGGTPVDTVGASNEGTSASNGMTTTSVTPGANGLLMVAATEWNALGAGTTAPTSSDLTADAATHNGQIDVISGYKTCSSGVGVTANLTAGKAGTPQWKWCQVTVREAAGGGAAPVLRDLMHNPGFMPTLCM